MSNTKKMAECLRPLRDKMAAGNYASFVQRIAEASAFDDLARLSRSLDRLYDAGVFSLAEFKKLDDKILAKAIRNEAGCKC